MLLRPALDHRHVRKLTGGLAQEGALPTVRLEQSDVAVRQRKGKGNARRAAARADIHDRALEPLHRVKCRKAFIYVHATRLARVANRRQTGCRPKSG
jgi:hypothetical protein